MSRMMTILAGLVLIVIAIYLALTVPVLLASGGCSPSPCRASDTTTLDMIGAGLAATLGVILAFAGFALVLRGRKESDR